MSADTLTDSVPMVSADPHQAALSLQYARLYLSLGITARITLLVLLGREVPTLATLVHCGERMRN